MQIYKLKKPARVAGSFRFKVDSTMLKSNLNALSGRATLSRLYFHHHHPTGALLRRVPDWEEATSVMGPSRYGLEQNNRRLGRNKCAKLPGYCRCCHCLPKVAG
jgi:hypothetical protein